MSRKKIGATLRRRLWPRFHSCIMDAHIPGTPGRQPTPLRYFMLAPAAGLVATAVIGVVMAYRFSQRPMVATICLLSGVALPTVLLWIYK
jgi:hypothetical protein